MDIFTNDKLKKLQETELAILKVFSEFCESNNLRYYLIGGALLGAVRYNGFIPWDDDIDVAMFREDYEALQELWGENPIKGYFLQSGKTDPLFARGILKLRCDGTHIKETSCMDLSMHDGIYIDIFPIDYTEASDGKALQKRAKIIRNLMTCRTIKSGYRGKRLRWLKSIIKVVLRPITSERIDRWIYKLCTKENNGKKTYAILFLHNYPWYKQIHLTSTFGNGSSCLFEGSKFIAPQNKEEFLKTVFGENYMKEPPQEKRVSPHSFCQIEFNTQNRL